MPLFLVFIKYCVTLIIIEILNLIPYTSLKFKDNFAMW